MLICPSFTTLNRSLYKAGVYHPIICVAFECNMFLVRGRHKISLVLIKKANTPILMLGEVR